MFSPAWLMICEDIEDVMTMEGFLVFRSIQSLGKRNEGYNLFMKDKWFCGDLLCGGASGVEYTEYVSAVYVIEILPV